MDLGKRIARLREDLRNLLRKLSFSQKLTIGLLGLLVALAVAAAVNLGRGETYTPLGTGGDAKAVAALRTLLDQHGIPHRTGTAGNLEVPRDRAAQARWLAAEHGVAGGKDTNLDWLFGEASFLDTQSRMDQRLLESRKRTVEDAIRQSRSIRDSRIVVQRGPEPIYASRASAAESAAVWVALRPQVDGLTRAEAGAIRGLVAGAFNLPPQNIQLTDDRLRSYPHVDAPGPGFGEEEDRIRRSVQATVESLLARVYRPPEFVVGVLTDFSLRRSQLKQVSYDPSKVATAERSVFKETESTTRGPGGTVGVVPNVSPGGGLGSAEATPGGEVHTRDRKESTFENRFDEKEERTEVPAGELKGLSVNVVLDRAAVRRVLQADEWWRLTPERKTAERVESESDITNFTVEGRLGAGNLDPAIEAYRRAQGEFLREQLPMAGSKVNVSVVTFPKPEPVVELAAAGRALGWAADHWSDLLLGTVAVVGLLAVARMFVRAAPAALDVPPLDESALAEEERAAEREVHRLEAELAAAKAPPPPRAAAAAPRLPAETDEATRTVVESVKEMSALSRQHPEMAAAVVKLWIAEFED